LHTPPLADAERSVLIVFLAIELRGSAAQLLVGAGQAHSSERYQLTRAESIVVALKLDIRLDRRLSRLPVRCVAQLQTSPGPFIITRFLRQLV
jgi:hypothetical protein